MDRVTLIVTALGAGAVAGDEEVASPAVKDAYGSLRALAQKRLEGRQYGKEVLARYEVDPGAWKARLTAELAKGGAGDDVAMVEAAHTLLSLADGTGFRARKYTPLPEEAAAYWDRAKMIAGLVAEPFGPLSAGSVTIGAAIVITILSAGRLEAVSNGNITTAQGILYSSGVGELALSVLLSAIPWAASAAFAILGIAFISLLFFGRRQQVMRWVIAGCAIVVGVSAARVIPTFVYGLLFLVPFGLIPLIMLVAFLSEKRSSSPGKAKDPKAIPAQIKTTPTQTRDPSWIVNDRWRPDILLYLRMSLVGALLLILLLSFYDNGMWLPPQRVQLHHGRPFTAYVLSRDDQGIELLRDRTRFIQTVPNTSIASISLCSFNTQTVNIPFLPLRMNRALSVPFASMVNAYKKGGGYPSCPS